MDDAAAAEFSAFYRQNHNLILLASIGRVRDRHTAEDITSEAFHIAWRYRQRGGELSLPWLYGVMRNLVGKEYRRSARSRRLTERVISLEPPPTLPAESDDEPLHAAMRKLRPAEREILFMAYWEELTGPEIARILSISQENAWVRLSRARAKLRREFKQTPLSTRPSTSTEAMTSG